MYFDIEDLVVIEAESHIRISNFCISTSKFLRYRRSSILKFLLIFSGPARAVQGRGKRSEYSTGVTGHRLQCRQLVETQFLAQDLKQYPVRSAWWRQWSSGARTDSIQQITSNAQATLCSWFHTEQDVSFHLQNALRIKMRGWSRWWHRKKSPIAKPSENVCPSDFFEDIWKYLRYLISKISEGIQSSRYLKVFLDVFRYLLRYLTIF